jgi:hypothetical protein
MKTYGGGTHEEKVQDYKLYKQKKFTARKSELKDILNHIDNSSLTEDDKETLLRELVDEINLVIYKKML